MKPLPTFMLALPKERVDGTKKGCLQVCEGYKAVKQRLEIGSHARIVAEVQLREFLEVAQLFRGEGAL